MSIWPGHLGKLATITTSTAPTLGKHNSYNDTSGSLTPTLPPLTTGAVATALAAGQLVRVKVSKSKGGSPTNTVTIGCTSPDTFEDGSTGFVLAVKGEKVTLTAGTIPGGAGPVWIIEEHTAPRDVQDSRYRRVFKPETFGALGGTTDDTAAVNAAIAAAQAAGGGTVELSQLYRCLGAITPVYTGTGTTTLQKPVRITGGMNGGWNGYWSAAPLNGGVGLDLRYDGTDTLHPAKIDTRGAGTLEIDHITLISGGSDDFPFFQTTNTTCHIHHNAVIGNPGKTGTACVQDAFIFGGTTTTVGETATAPFQGYGSRIHDNYFSAIRYGWLARAYCNSIPFENNTFSTTCGSSTGGAVKIDGQGGAAGFAVGNSTKGNTIEVSHYKYGVELFNAQNTNLGPDGYWDQATGWVAPIYVDSTSGNTTAVAGYHSDAFPFVIDQGNTTTIINGHQSQKTVFPQYVDFSNATCPAFAVHANGEGFRAHTTAGSGAGIAALAGPAGSADLNEAQLMTYPPVWVTDGVTTSGSAVVTSASAAWVNGDVGMPIKGTGIPNGTKILSRQSATQVTLTANATATGTAITFQFGRLTNSPLVQVGFSRQHIVTKGAVGTASPTGAAGSGATASASGTDSCFDLTITTGTSPTSGLLVNVSQQTNWGATPKPVFAPIDAATAAVCGSSQIFFDATTSNIRLNAGVALPASSTFKFRVMSMQ